MIRRRAHPLRESKAERHAYLHTDSSRKEKDVLLSAAFRRGPISSSSIAAIASQRKAIGKWWVDAHERPASVARVNKEENQFIVRGHDSRMSTLASKSGDSRSASRFEIVFCFRKSGTPLDRTRSTPLKRTRPWVDRIVDSILEESARVGERLWSTE
ncbi:hypothetical protein PRIPAC_93941, partial [Pristionchus pacificus]|uniref:Uncharacterized protein n=1 Tax=Pristionchus pacificus TaxID=54126 RepID=A0A2A6CH42_PRIPA